MIIPQFLQTEVGVEVEDELGHKKRIKLKLKVSQNDKSFKTLYRMNIMGKNINEMTYYQWYLTKSVKTHKINNLSNFCPKLNR